MIKYVQRLLLASLLLAASLPWIAPPVGARQPIPAAADLSDRGDQLMKDGKAKEAQEIYEEAIALDPEVPELHNHLGLALARQNLLDEAAQEFRRAIKIDPMFLNGLNNLGSIMYRQHNYDTALVYYERWLKIVGAKPPKDKTTVAEVLTNLASVYRDRATFVGGAERDQDFQKALEYYRKALAVDAEFAQAHNNMGLCLMRLKQFPDAEREVKRAIALKPDYATAYFNLGMINHAMGRAPEARAAFEQSLKFESIPYYADATRQRLAALGGAAPAQWAGGGDMFASGCRLLGDRRWAQAEKDLHKACAGSHKKDPIAWNNLGFAIAQQGRYREAIEHYRTAASILAGRFPAAHYNMGQAYRLSGEPSQAKKAFVEALKEAGNRHALTHNALALVLKQTGDRRGAMQHYKMALMQSGDTLPVVHFNMAVLLEADGQARKAVDQYRIYLEKSPKGYNADSARNHIQRIQG